MLAVAFPAAAFGTNCYVLAPGPGEECVVVDPGIGVEQTLRDVLAEHRLRPAAVLLTHGHVDHVYSVAPVCGGDTAAYIHTDDRYRLHDPLGNVMPGLLEMLEQQFGAAGHVARARPGRRGHRPPGAAPSPASTSRCCTRPATPRAR